MIGAGAWEVLFSDSSLYPAADGLAGVRLGTWKRVARRELPSVRTPKGAAGKRSRRRGQRK